MNPTFPKSRLNRAKRKVLDGIFRNMSHNELITMANRRRGRNTSRELLVAAIDDLQAATQ